LQFAAGRRRVVTPYIGIGRIDTRQKYQMLSLSDDILKVVTKWQHFKSRH
jgi:hypothetical protein